MRHEIENPIVMRASIQVIDKIKDTKAKGWKDLKVGDIIDLTIEIKNNRRSIFGYYQSYINLFNKTQNYNFNVSFVEFVKYTTNNFKIKQIN